MLKEKMSYKYAIITTAVILISLVIFSFAIGRYPVMPNQLFDVVKSKITGIPHAQTANIETVILRIRTPRILLAMLVGCSVSVAGACYQGIFQNPLASPDILGASSGAGFGASLAILAGLSVTLVSVSAFVFSVSSILLVFFISKFTKGKKIVGMILTGIMVGNLFTAGTSYIKLVADPADQLPEITYWLMGSFNGCDMADVKFLGIAMLIGIIPMLLLRWKMNILTLGEDESRSIGVNSSRIRWGIVACATLITSASVAVSGIIGWVGLIVPNMCRKVVGNDYRKLLPISMLWGGGFMLFVDNIARTMSQSEIPLSILTAVVGAPFFITLIMRRGES